MSEDSRPLIVHVIHHLVMGGMENGLVNLINTMPASKFRHAVFCIEDFSDFRHRVQAPDVDVVALHRSRIGAWRLRQEIYRLCRQLRPQIVHSRNLSGLDALLPARLAGVPHCVHGEHGWDVDNLDGQRWKPALLRRLHSPLIDRYIAVSKDLARFLRARVGIAASRITQIYNGVDTERFSPLRARQADWLPLEIRGENLVIVGSIGRIQPVKDHETLLRAFARVVGEQPLWRERLRLTVIGDGPLLADLRELADALGISPQTWFPGALSNIPEVLAALDIFVLPSLAEGTSNTVLEAMAAGIPVLATATGGNLELVADDVCGRLFAPRDVETLARLIREYVLKPELRQEHGRAARRTAVEKFSLPGMVAGYQGVYDSLLRTSVPASRRAAT